MVSYERYVMSRAVRDAYRRGQEDETLEPLVLASGGKPLGRIRGGDSVIFYNIRGEREIELTESLTDRNFDKFPVENHAALNFATMIEYRQGLNVKVAFPPEGRIRRTLSEVLSENGLKQVKITEAEKAVHVSFFLNGKNRELVPGEELVIVPTRKDVALFDEAPEMSIENISSEVVERIHDPTWDFILVNFPNVDVVGHIENERAVLRAVEVVDDHTGRIVKEALAEGMAVIITADHGTVEKWLYADGAVDTGHTDSPVPFLVLAEGERIELREDGELSDIAPTVLRFFGIPKPAEMTGRPLCKNVEWPATGKKKRRLLLIILDGWGIQDRAEGNLIASARTPVMDRLVRSYPSTRLKASGEAVGLPEGTVGNSEVGHLHIGAGRRVYSDRVRIDSAIEDGSFFTNSAFLDAIRHARAGDAALHLIGIVSFFSSHGSLNHLLALMELAKKQNVRNLYIHAMLGRRGEMPESGANYIEMIEKKTDEMRMGRVVSVIGRYWSMDREENWDRIEKTYRMLVYGEGRKIEALRT
ncbi:MAG: alkaline phosphatase family protein [Syntrophales bacterium]